MPPVNPEILAKLQKILARADTARGATEAEATAAMAMAARLATQHNIDLAQVSSTQDANGPTAIETDRKNVTGTTRNRRLHHNPIAVVLMQCFDVQMVWMGNGANAAIIGEKTDVAIASYCWAWLGEVFPRLYKQYAHDHDITIGSAGEHVRRRSYYDGLRAGICETNRRHREEVKSSAQGEQFALVLVKKEEIVQSRMVKEFPNLRKARSTRTDVDLSALMHGQRTGRDIKLNAGLSATTATASLK